MATAPTPSTSTTTSALVLSSLNTPLHLRQIHLAPLAPDEILVEIQATGICHTDLSCMDGTIPISGFPAVLGHEGAGIVVATGSGVSSAVALKGDTVLLSVNTCQNCANCRSGHPNYCDQGMARNFGGRRVHDGSATVFVGGQDDDGDESKSTSDSWSPCFANFFGQSSFSRLAVVNQSCVVKVPGGLSAADLRLFAPLGCGISTGVGSVLNALNVKEGSSVAIFGVGSVGLSAVMAARKLRHAGVVIAVDINPARLEVAKLLGATHVVDASGNADVVVEQVKKHVAASSTPGDGVNFALDATGSPSVIATMLDCLAVRGRAAQVGLAAPDKTVPVKILQHLLRGQEYVGCAGGDCVPSKMLPYLVEQQRAGNFPLEDMVSYYDVKDHLKAFEDSRTGRAIKAVLCWS